MNNQVQKIIAAAQVKAASVADDPVVGELFGDIRSVHEMVREAREIEDEAWKRLDKYLARKRT